MEFANLIDPGMIGPRGAGEEQDKFLCDELRWDKLDAKHIWTFGPNHEGFNILITSTLLEK